MVHHLLAWLNEQVRIAIIKHRSGLVGLWFRAAVWKENRVRAKDE